MSLLTYLDPNAIKDASIEGIKIKDGTISSSKIDKTVASKSYVDTKVTNAVQITYSALKALRDAGKLVPGTQYRITDYTCTTIQENTKSAGHIFDIIVTADDESTLNEEARAVKHKFYGPEQDYFKDCNLSAWKIWYCLDNDTNRFAWADGERLIDTINFIKGGSETYTYTSPISKIVFKGNAYNLEIGVRTMIFSTPPVYITKTDDYTLVVEDKNNGVTGQGISVYTDSKEGKGVIYRMIDEFGNDVPYDFKNIQFYRQWDATKSLWSTISSDNTGVPCYTFSSTGDSTTTSFKDKSLASSNNVYSNVIGKYVSSNKQTLNNNCFFGTRCYNNTFGNGCYGNTFGNEYDSNCSSNTFGNDCYNNTFRAGYGSNCILNTFGNNCDSNAFGRGCRHNIFGNSCGSNTFGNFCHDNTFGNSCGSNTFGNFCHDNTFGNNCQYNTFGNDCQYSTFGNNCSDIKFASDASATTKYNYYQNNHFGDGCQYIVFKGAGTASNAQQVQNYKFAQGLQGTDSAYLTIDGVRNLSYETKVAKDSNGELKIYCEADLIL